MTAVLAVAALLVASSAVAAEPSSSDKETSRGLFAEGTKALEAADYKAAAKACGAAFKLVPASTPGVCLGRALVGLGKLVEARDAFLTASRYPTKDGEPAVIAEARETARVEAEKLVARIPAVVLVVSGPSSSSPLRVTIDGASIATDTARLPRRLDPGHHVVIVTASGFVEARVDVTVGEGEERRVSVTLQPAAPGAEPSSPGSRPPLTAYVAFGVGGAGLVLGVVAGLVAGSKHSTLAGQCDASNTCPPSAQSDLDSFHSMRTISTIGYVVGAVGLVGGGVLWLTAPTGRASGPSARVWVAPTSAGIGGTF